MTTPLLAAITLANERRVLTVLTNERPALPGRGTGPEVWAVREVLHALDGVQRPPRPEVAPEVLELLILELGEPLQGRGLGPQLVLGVEGEVFAGYLAAVNVVSPRQYLQLIKNDFVLDLNAKVGELFLDRATIHTWIWTNKSGIVRKIYILYCCDTIMVYI